MKILLTGATGFIGQQLLKKLLSNGHTLVALSRNKKLAKKKIPQEVEIFEWSQVSEAPPPKEAFNGIEAVINLMGENLSEKRWSPKQKEKIYNSRVLSTQNLIKGLKSNLKEHLKVLISASAIGYYITNREEQLNEESPKGEGFLADLCDQWEKATDDQNIADRVLKIRIGVVIEKGGGILGKLAPLFNLGLGGPIGSGSHMMSWIHLEDLTNIISEGLEHEEYEGVINGVSPHPVSNREFSKSLGNALKRPVLFPVPPFILKFAFGEMSTIMLDGQSIVSQKLKDLNFSFKQPKIEEALQKIFKENNQS
jgi:uncharacterized protein (TIGR01777 family)